MIDMGMNGTLLLYGCDLKHENKNFFKYIASDGAYRIVLNTFNSSVYRTLEQKRMGDKYIYSTEITGKHSKYTRAQLETVFGDSYSPIYCAVGKIKSSKKMNNVYTTNVDLESLVRNMEEAGFTFQ